MYSFERSTEPIQIKEFKSTQEATVTIYLAINAIYFERWASRIPLLSSKNNVNIKINKKKKEAKEKTSGFSNQYSYSSLNARNHKR